MTERAPPLWLKRTVAALVVLLFGLHLLARDTGAYWYGDAAQYVLHAENLVAGRPYADTGVLQNAGRSLTPIAYPPGFPLALAPVIAVAGRSRGAIVALQAACLMASAWLFAVLYWRRLRPGSVLVLVLVIGLSPYLGQLVNSGIADFWFLVVAAFSLVALDQARRAETERRAVAWSVAAGLGGGGAVLIRTLGVVLLPAFVLPAFVLPALRRDGRARRRPAVVAVLVAIVVAATITLAVDWEAGGQTVSAGGRADTGYDAIVTTVLVKNAARIPRHVVNRVVAYARDDYVAFWSPPLVSRWVHIPLRLAGVFLVLLGLWVSVRRPRAAEAFAVLYLLALLPWSFGWTRYLIPALPILYALLLLGAERVSEWGEEGSAVRRARTLAAVIVCGLLLVPFLWRGASQMAERIADGPTPVRADGSALLREATPPGAVVLTTQRDPRSLVFASGRSGSATPRDTASWNTYADRVGATFLLATDDKSALHREDVSAWAARSGWRLATRSEVADLYARTGLAP